jgi:hypothetical protein
MVWEGSWSADSTAGKFGAFHAFVVVAVADTTTVGITVTATVAFNFVVLLFLSLL